MSSLIGSAVDDGHTNITSHDSWVDGPPLKTFARLRNEEPVAWCEEEDDGAGYWAITRYKDILDVSRDVATFTSAEGIRLEDMSAEETAARRTMMELDPPDHTRLRRLVTKVFTRKSVEEYEDQIRTLAVQVIETALERPNFDFVEDVAKQLPMLMLGQLLGTPNEDGPRLVELGDALLGNTDPEFTDVVVDQVDSDQYRLIPFRSPAGLELFEYAGQQAMLRKEKALDDVISRIMAPTRDGEPLSDHEFKNFFTLLVAAGNDTTRYTMTGSLDILLDRPDLIDYLRDADAEQWRMATDELLRLTTVTTHFRRTATADVELRDAKISAGDRVVMYYTAGNRDERQFTDPDAVDLARSPNDHVSFGRGGPHFCLGAWLARMELRVTLQEFFARVNSVERDGPQDRLRSNFICGIKHLPIAVTTR